MTLVSEIILFGVGWFVGLLIAMPVGPVAALAVKRTLRDGWPVGTATGLGAAMADMIYASIAAFGVLVVQEFLINHQYSIRLVGGLVLVCVGAHMLWQKATLPAERSDDDTNMIATTPRAGWKKMLRGFMTGLVITMTNPLTLIAFLTIFTNFGLSSEITNYELAAIFVLGALAGAASWWLSLVAVVALIKAQISETMIAKINGILAIILVIAGLYAVLTGYFEKPLIAWLK